MKDALHDHVIRFLRHQHGHYFSKFMARMALSLLWSIMEEVDNWRLSFRRSDLLQILLCFHEKVLRPLIVDL